MTGKVLCCVLTVILFSISNTGAVRNGARQIDHLIESLHHEEWRDDEEPCKKDTFLLLNGVKNQTTWATWIWDSMQLPGAVLYGARYHLGSFDQCLEDPWSQQPSQYCLVDVTLTEDTRAYEEVDPTGSVEELVGIRTKYGNRRVNFYSMGVCLPASCAPSSVAKVSRHIHQLSHLPFGHVTVQPHNCQVKGSKLEFSTGFYVLWLIIFTTTAIATTVYILEDSITNPNLIKIANWFSPSKNFEALTSGNQDELMSLNGLRVFCAGTAVVMHYIIGVIFLAIMNPVDVAKSASSVQGWFVVQLALLIDAFFVMSGLLLMTGLLKRRTGLVEMIFKRYLRLIVPLALCLLYISAVLPHTVSGPLQPQLIAEQVDVCTDQWWIPLLMVNNFVKPEQVCPFQTWYLSCDFQLTILATTAFWLCQKWRRPTVVRFCVAVYLMSLVVPAAMTYWYEVPAILAYDIDEAANFSKNRVLQTTYIKPHSRASAYLTGLALGYVMHVYKPKDHRKSISKTWSILGGILGLILMLGVMGVGGSLNLMKYNPLLVSVYMAFDRCIFAMGVSLLIIVSEYGTFPILGDFLTSKVFVPLSRVSYSEFLFHPLLIWQILYSTRVPLAYDFFHLFVNGFGYIVVVSLISYLLWFIIESPVSNIINSVFANRKTNISSSNGIGDNDIYKIKQS